MATGPKPAATATALPEDEPPGVYFQGYLNVSVMMNFGGYKHCGLSR